MKTKNITALCLVTLISAACSTETPRPRVGAAPSPTPHGADGEFGAPINPVDPSTAQVSVVAQPSLAPASVESQLRVPQFNVTYQNADFVEVLRCRAAYVFRVPTGEDARTLGPDRASDLRFAWADAFGTPNECQLVGAKMARDAIQDLAAKSGHYYYALNPCIAKSRSVDQNLSGSNLCSYKLVFTQPIKYENNLTNTFIETARKLALEEGQFAAIFGDLKYLASAIRYEQENCELRQNVATANRAVFTGLVSLLSMSVQVATGAVFAGPVSQILGVNNVVGLAGKFILGNGSGSTITCDRVTELSETYRQRTEQIEGQIQNVVKIRTELANLQQGYAKLDAQLLQNGTGSTPP